MYGRHLYQLSSQLNSNHTKHCEAKVLFHTRNEQKGSVGFQLQRDTDNLMSGMKTVVILHGSL